MAQGRLIMKAAGADQAKIDEADALRGRMVAIVRAETDPAAAAAKLRAAMASEAKAQGLSDAAIEAQVAQIEQTLAPIALETMTHWILRHVGPLTQG